LNSFNEILQFSDVDLLPTVFEGFKFTLNKMLSTHFQVNHSLTMSSIAPSGYKFGATYVGTKQFSPTEVKKVFNAHNIRMKNSKI